MTQAEQGTSDWTGRTVRDRNGAKLGTLVELIPTNGEGPADWGVVRSAVGRRRLIPLTGAAADSERDLQVPVDRAAVRAAPTTGSTPNAALSQHYSARGLLADAGTLQHERFGGARLGSAFFGWLVAVGLTVILGAVAGGVAAAVGAPAAVDPATSGITSAGVGLVVLAVGYCAGGYVAGRLARFDGARNGFLTWLVGIVAAAALAIVALLAGVEYDALARAQAPALPVAADQLTAAGILTLVAAAVVTLLAAVLGGKAGEHFHRKVDRAALDVV